MVKVCDSLSDKWPLNRKKIQPGGKRRAWSVYRENKGWRAHYWLFTVSLCGIDDTEDLVIPTEFPPSAFIAKYKADKMERED